VLDVETLLNLTPARMSFLKRFFSTTQHSSSINNECERLFHNFKRVAPCFPHRGSTRIVNTPAEFYQLILDGIDKSQTRIVLSSLYLGAGNQSKTIVRFIVVVVVEKGNEFCFF
jgi:hypothetical protein